MKKLLFLIAVVSVFMVGCGQSEDMSSPPADTSATSTNAAGTSTNQ